MMVALCGSVWALNAEIGMIISLPRHPIPMSVTQHYFNYE